MSPILGYFSPETMLPLSSLIATLMGFGLLIKRSTLRFAVNVVRAAFRKQTPSTGPKPPHFAKVRTPTRDEVHS